MTTVKEVIQRIEQFAPTYLAEDWDPIGLSFGSKEKEIRKIMVALDVDTDTLKEAKEKQVDLIFTHHPAIFSSLKTLNEEDSRRKEYIELIRSDIAVFSAHTNIDAAEDGMNDWLADAIGLPKEREIVEVTYEESYKKIAVYVPEYASEKVRQVMHEAGAGEVGNYGDVSYTLKGHGRFTPQEGSNPAEGMIGETEVIEEERIEMMVPNHLKHQVIDALYASHPYEEPVFDLYTLEAKGKPFGYGRIGTLTTSTRELAEHLKGVFKLDGIRFASKNPDEQRQKVAIFGGSGGSYYSSALAKGAEIFITGDISYHTAQDMLRDGIDVIDAGHYIEHIFVEKMVEKLNAWAEEEKWDVEIFPTTTQKDVFNFK